MIEDELGRAERELRELPPGGEGAPERLAAALERAVAAYRRSPEEGEAVFSLPELLGELSETYEALVQPAQALEAMQQAMATADPERLVGQLVDLRQQSLEALARDADELQRRGEEFRAAPPPRPQRRPAGFDPVPSAHWSSAGAPLSPGDPRRRRSAR